MVSDQIFLFALCRSNVKHMALRAGPFLVTEPQFEQTWSRVSLGDIQIIKTLVFVVSNKKIFCMFSLYESINKTFDPGAGPF